MKMVFRSFPLNWHTFRSTVQLNCTAYKINSTKESCVARFRSESHALGFNT